jgi:hypothetical protein
VDLRPCRQLSCPQIFPSHVCSQNGNSAISDMDRVRSRTYMSLSSVLTRGRSMAAEQFNELIIRGLHGSFQPQLVCLIMLS